MKNVVQKKAVVRNSKRESKLKKKLSNTTVSSHKRVKECQSLHPSPTKSSNLRSNLNSMPKWVQIGNNLRNRVAYLENLRYEQSLKGKIRKVSENSNKTESEKGGSQFTWHELFLNGGCQLIKQDAVQRVKQRREGSSSRRTKGIPDDRLRSRAYGDFEKIFDVIKRHASKKEKTFLELKKNQFQTIYQELACLGQRSKNFLLNAESTSNESIESEVKDVTSTTILASKAEEGLTGGDDLKTPCNGPNLKKHTKSVRFLQDEEHSSSVGEKTGSSDVVNTKDSEGNSQNLTLQFTQEIKREVVTIEGAEELDRENKSTSRVTEEPCPTASKILLLEFQKEVQQNEENILQYNKEITIEPNLDKSETATPKKYEKKNQATETLKSDTAESNETQEIVISNTEVPRKDAGNNQTEEFHEPITEQSPSAEELPENTQRSLLSQNGYEANQESTENPDISSRNWINEFLEKIESLSKEDQNTGSSGSPDEFEQNIKNSSDEQYDGQAAMLQLEKIIEEIRVGLIELRKKCEDESKKDITSSSRVADSNENYSNESREGVTFKPSSASPSSWKAYSYAKHLRAMQSCGFRPTVTPAINNEREITNREQKNSTDDGSSGSKFTGCQCMLSMFENVSEGFQNITTQECSETKDS